MADDGAPKTCSFDTLPTPEATRTPAARPAAADEATPTPHASSVVEASPSATSSSPPAAEEATTWSLPAPLRGPCAVCTHRRRCCQPGCPFAPHFPGDQLVAFKAVRRIFGVSAVCRLMRKVGWRRHEDLIRTVKYEATAWELYPASGAMGVVRDHVARLRSAYVELVSVKHEIQELVAACRGSDGPQQHTGEPLDDAAMPHAAAAATQNDCIHPATRLPSAAGQHQTTAAQGAAVAHQLAASGSGGRQRTELNLTMQQNAAAAATQSQYDPHGDGHPSQCQKTVNGARKRKQDFQNAADAPASNSAVEELAAAPLGSAHAGASVFQPQQPPPSPPQLGTAPRYRQELPSLPPSPWRTQ